MNRKAVIIWLIIGICIGSISTSTAGRGVNPVRLVAEDPGAKVPEVNADQQLFLPVSEAKYLNRIYTERSNEIAYCTLVTDNRMQVWLADTLSSHVNRVEFSIENCPVEGRVGTMHTHPNGNLGLSEQDKQTFINSRDEFMCIQAGTITTVVGAKAEHIGCFVLGDTDQKGRIMSVPIFISNTADDEGDSI